MPHITPLVIVWLFMQVIVDAFISRSSICMPRRHSYTIISYVGDCHFPFANWFCKTDTILSRFIRSAIQTGLFAGIFALSGLITFLVLPDMNIYAIFAIPSGCIYTNVSVVSTTEDAVQ